MHFDRVLIDAQIFSNVFVAQTFVQQQQQLVLPF